MKSKGVNVILVGYPGAGKSLFAKLLQERYGYRIIEMGQYVKEACLKKNCSPYECANIFYQTGRETYFAEKLVEERLKYPYDDVVIVGPRTPKEIKYLKTYLCQTISIAINSNATTRLCRRAKQTQRKDEFSLWCRDYLESTWDLFSAMKQCDYQINNSENWYSV